MGWEMLVGDHGNAPQVDTDIVLSEAPAGLPQPDQLVLYLVSVIDIRDVDGKPVTGDALLVRPRGTPKREMLSAVLGCSVEHLPVLLHRESVWSVRELTHIDGHRIRVEPE